MTLPISIAQKLLLLVQTEKLPFSSVNHPIVKELLQDGILQKIMQGRGKAYLVLPSPHALTHYLHNRFGIANLEAYVKTLQDESLTRSEAVEVSSSSKVKKIRSFTGFMVTSLQPVMVALNNEPFQLSPHEGLFTYVSDYENFSIPADITIIGIENAANFANLQRQAYLFADTKAMFVCRYPFSGDLVKWLQQIPNRYLHFGDYDFAGIHIFLNEYWKHLQSKASYFVPDNMEEMMGKYGNRELYNNQQAVELDPSHTAYPYLQPVINAIHKHKKGLEQEIFITT